MKRFAALCLLFGCLFAAVGCEKRACTHENAVEQTVAPTCTEAGKVLSVCPDCGAERLLSWLEPTGHDFQNTVTAPTCTDSGFTVHTCKICGFTFTDSYTNAAGHTAGEWITDRAPACGVSGSRHTACTVCGEILLTEPIPSGEHVYQIQTTKPTCEEQGYTDYRCTVCEFSFRSDYTAPTGHNFVKTAVTHVTCTHPGCTTYTCSECQDTYTGDYVLYSDLFSGAYVGNAKVLAKGLDVSKYNHVKINELWQPLDWNAIRSAGYSFVILKAGSSRGIEPTFEADYAGAVAAGLDVGIYFYTYAETVADTRKDAEMLAGWLDGKQLAYPIYYDLEDDGLASNEKLTPAVMTDLCVAFLDELQERGYYGAFYSNHTWLTERLQGELLKGMFDYWYARYPGTAEPTWDRVKYGQEVGMWQFTSTGTIDGCGAVTFDLDYAYRDYPTIIKEYHLNGF